MIQMRSLSLRSCAVLHSCAEATATGDPYCLGKHGYMRGHKCVGGGDEPGAWHI